VVFVCHFPGFSGREALPFQRNAQNWV